jgi:hypothetical protein
MTQLQSLCTVAVVATLAFCVSGCRGETGARLDAVDELELACGLQPGTLDRSRIRDQPEAPDDLPNAYAEKLENTIFVGVPVGIANAQRRCIEDYRRNHGGYYFDIVSHSRDPQNALEKD